MKPDKRSLLICLFLLAVLTVSGQSSSNPPSETREPAKGAAIPKDLNEAHATLKRLLSEENLKTINEVPDADGMIRFHHSLGMWIRNSWGLWSGSELYTWFNNRGYTEPDEISGLILQTFWLKLHDKPYQVNQAFGPEWIKAQKLQTLRVDNDLLWDQVVRIVKELDAASTVDPKVFAQLASSFRVLEERKYDFGWQLDEDVSRRAYRKVLNAALSDPWIMANFISLMCEDGKYVFQVDREQLVLELMKMTPETLVRAYLLLPPEEAKDLVFEIYLITIKQRELFEAAIRKLETGDFVEAARKLASEVDKERDK